MDDPLARFEQEHQEALGELAKLETAVAALRQRRDVETALGTVRRVHEFLSTAVRRHNENEERALFGLLDENAPTRLFVDEHGTLRSLEHELASALATARAKDVARVAVELIETLRAHIDREDHMLFPMARAQLGADGLAQVARRLKELDQAT